MSSDEIFNGGQRKEIRKEKIREHGEKLMEELAG